MLSCSSTLSTYRTTTTFQNAMGITFNNLAAVINIMASEHDYKIVSTACDNHTMYVFTEKARNITA